MVRLRRKDQDHFSAAPAPVVRIQVGPALVQEFQAAAQVVQPQARGVRALEADTVVAHGQPHRIALSPRPDSDVEDPARLGFVVFQGIFNEPLKGEAGHRKPADTRSDVLIHPHPVPEPRFDESQIVGQVGHFPIHRPGCAARFRPSRSI